MSRPGRAGLDEGGRGLFRAGGLAALYIALADLLAIPYFLVVVNYPGAVDPVDKVVLLRDHHASLYLMHIVSFEFTALCFLVVTLMLHQRLRAAAPSVMPFFSNVPRMTSLRASADRPISI